MSRLSAHQLEQSILTGMKRLHGQYLNEPQLEELEQLDSDLWALVDAVEEGDSP